MSQHPRDHVPLGEILTKARFDKRMTRAEVARAAGVSENSLVRYEKAGLEKDGQYPPSPKLAKLCFVLDVPPLKAMFGCLEPDDYEEYRHYTWEEWLMGHPDHEYLFEQWSTLVNENFKLSTALKTLLSPPADKETWQREHAERAIAEGMDQVRKQNEFYTRLVEAGVHTPGTPMGGFSVAGSRERDIWNYADFIENGPGNASLDRSQSSTTNPEAAPTASTDTDHSGGDK